MNVILQSLFSLVSVVIGGFISYKSQTKHQEKIEKRNDERQKEIAYNKFLLLDRDRTPLIIPVHHDDREGFDEKIYDGGIRQILYENLHLLDRKIVENILKIDFVGERAEVMGPEPEDNDEIFKLYSEIRDIIKKDYKNNIKGYYK